MNLFASVKYNGEINTDENFKTFARAMITLFRSSTGELYNTIMHNLMIQPPYCQEGFNCGTVYWPPLFFVAFIVAANFIMHRMFVAVVVTAFLGSATSGPAGKNQRGPFRLTDDLLDAYRDVWQRVSAGDIAVNLAQLRNLLQELPHPLGLHGDESLPPDVAMNKEKMRKHVDAFLNTLVVVPDESGKFHFHGVLQALVARASNQNPEYCAVQVSDGGATNAAPASFTLREIRAAIRLQRAWRSRRAMWQQQAEAEAARRAMEAQERELQQKIEQQLREMHVMRNARVAAMQFGDAAGLPRRAP